MTNAFDSMDLAQAYEIAGGYIDADDATYEKALEMVRADDARRPCPVLRLSCRVVIVRQPERVPGFMNDGGIPGRIVRRVVEHHAVGQTDAIERKVIALDFEFLAPPH